MPTHFHAIVWIDHSQAKVFHIGLSGDDEVTMHPHLPTRHLHHKANSIGSGHAGLDKEFFAQVMNAVSDAGEILIIGPSSAKTELANCASDTQQSATASSPWKLAIIPAIERSWPMPSGILKLGPQEQRQRAEPPIADCLCISANQARCSKVSRACGGLR